MTDAKKKAAAKKSEHEAPKDKKDTADAKEAKAAPAKKAAPSKAADAGKASEDKGGTDKEDKEAGKGVKGKGTSTKGPTKSAPGSTEAPKAKPDQQPPSAFSKPLTPSKELAAVLGTSEALPRTVIVSKVWEYIKKHKLQNESNKREILADAKLKPIFEADMRTMFEMNKYINNHLKS